MQHELADARYVRDRQGWPLLELTVDGRPVSLGVDHSKPTLAKAGLTYLGPEFADVASVQWEGQTLPGYTDDARVATLFRDFLATFPFVPGPVVIPE